MKQSTRQRLSWLLTFVALVAAALFLRYYQRAITREKVEIARWQLNENSRVRVVAEAGIDEQGLTYAIVEEWSDGAEELLGWTREEVLGRPIGSFLVPEEFRGEHQQRMTDAIIARQLSNGKRYQFLACVVPHKDGHLIPVYVLTTLIHGEPLRMTSLMIRQDDVHMSGVKP